MKISVTKIKCFESCRRAYKFRYIEGLESVQKADALATGINYHERIEQLYKDGYCTVNDCSVESAMSLAYEKYVYPLFKVKAVEKQFEYPLGEHVLIGRVDGVAEDGIIVEHKTTSSNNLEEYEYNLQWDEQILAYMLGYGARKMWYTVIRKPSIRKKKDETDEEFFDRMCKWYDEDTDQKIKVILIERTDEQVEDFRKNIGILADMMKEAEKNEELLYRNPLHCNCWGRRCEYSGICLNYVPGQQYIDFVQKEGKNDF